LAQKELYPFFEAISSNNLSVLNSSVPIINDLDLSRKEDIMEKVKALWLALKKANKLRPQLSFIEGNQFIVMHLSIMAVVLIAMGGFIYAIYVINQIATR
jgi:hypothetical protein